ncbi:methyl viologen-reducing hydrogenase maturation protease [Geobacter metallireducens GS-15]|uniref:Methyl viologen-reducing hydrogenase maturation protease n=1 Tax=Geobacter metallireducens (strain ATCC 53774 / DSM 7210 / GS-15) TaxID=269799 RepID=Q39QD8_GEOMG|nr:methyl viologen-reducing hydrogenase maturation protease [Geobacter metallireducens GS-15]
MVCVGNDLVADDAAGFEVYRKLAGSSLPPGVTLHYAAVGGIDLLDYLTGDESAMIVVDAVQFGAPTGTIHNLGWNELPDFGAGAISAHFIGLKETIDIGRCLYPELIPSTVLLVGIEGRRFDQTRDAMSPEVAAAIEPATASIREHLHTLRQGT